MSDGANVFDAASVSPDHAVVTDPLLLDAIEVQRGPAAIRYGGNAVNGAVEPATRNLICTTPLYHWAVNKSRKCAKTSQIHSS